VGELGGVPEWWIVEGRDWQRAGRDAAIELLARRERLVVLLRGARVGLGLGLGLGLGEEWGTMEG
jgi:hypothetical protein